MATKRGGGGKVVVPAELQMDVVFAANKVKAEIDKILKDVDVSKVKSDKGVKLSSSQENVKNAENELRQARRLLVERVDVLTKQLDGVTDFFSLPKDQQTKIRQGLAAVERASKEASSALNTVAEAAKIGRGGEIKKYNAMYARGAEAVRSLNESTKKLKVQTDANAEEKRRQVALARSETELDRRRVAAKKLQNARLLQQQKAGLVKELTGKAVSALTPQDISGFDTAQKAAIQGALESRRTTAKLRADTTLAFDKNNVEKIRAVTKALLDANAALSNYKTLQAEASKIIKRTAAEEAKDEKSRKAALADAKLALKQRDEALKRRLDDFVKERQEKSKEREKDRKDSLADAKLAYQQRQQRLKDNLAAFKKEKAAKEKEANEELARRRILERDEIRAYAEADKRRQRAEAQRYAQTEKAVRQRLALQQKQAVAKDTLSGYNVSSFKNLDFRSIARQDLKPLLEYAKAQELVTRNALARAAAQKRSQPVIDRVTRSYEQQINVVRQLEARYRSLHSPLQQVNLLFRQFFRFAIGYGALYQMLGAIRALIGGVVDLNSAMKSIQAITASTDTQMKSLEVTIKRVATTTKFNTTQIAEATQILGQAGVTAQELPSALQATADFAAATAANLTTAADLITTVRDVFSELDDNTIADQLTKAINISKLTAEDLKTILSLSAQTAKSYDLTSEQYLAAVTTLRNAGIKASTVATGLRQGLIEIFAPDANTIKVLKDRYDQLGETLSEEAVKQRFFGFKSEQNPLLAVLNELKRVGFADDAQKEFQRAFDVRATNAIKALIRNLDELAAAESKITFGQAAAEAAQIQMESLSNSLSNLGAAFTVFGDAILGGPVNSLEDLVDSATDAINALTRLDIELKKQGKSGLGTALFPALAGGVAGAFAGKSVKQKFGLGALGTLAGGASGLFPAAFTGAEGSVGAGVGGAVGTGVLGSLLAYLGIRDLKGLVNAKNAPKQMALDLESSAVKAFISGQQGGGISKFLAKIGGARLVAFVPYIGPFISAAFTILGIVSTIVSLFDTGGSDLEQANNKLQGTLADLDNAKAENAKAKEAIEEYDVKAATLGHTAGKTANTIVSLQRQLQSARQDLQTTFGKVADEDLGKLEELITGFARANLGERKGLAISIKTLTGTEKSLAEIDRDAYTLSARIEDLTSSANGILASINDKMIKTYERIQEAEAKGEAPAQEDLDVAKIFQESDKLRDAILGRGTFTPEELAKFAADFAQKLSDTQRDLLNKNQEASDEALKKKTEEHFKAQIEKALSSASKTSAINLEILLRSYIDNLAEIGGLTEETIDSYNKVLQDTIDKIREQRAGRAGKRTRRRGADKARYQGIANENEVEAAAVATQEGLQQDKERLIQAGKDLQKATIDSAIAQVEQFSELIQTPAGKAAAESLLQQTTGDAKEAVQQLLSTPEALANFISELKAANVDITDLQDPKLPANLAAVLKVLTAASQSANVAVDAEKQYDKYIKDLPSPANLAEIDRLDRQIRLLQGRNKENIDQLLTESNQNPIYRRRDLLQAEKQKEIRQLKKDIDELDPEKNRAQLDKKTVDKIIQLETRLGKAQGELLDYEDQAIDAVQQVRDKYNAIILKRREQAAELDKKVAEINVSLAGQTVDVASFNRSIDQIDKANAELLDVFRKQLIQDGISPAIAETKALYEEEVALRAFELRKLRLNSEEFLKQLERFTAGMKEQADLLRNRPVTAGGAAQDVISESYGTVGNERRREKAAQDRTAVIIDAAQLGIERANLRQNQQLQLAEAERQKTAGNPQLAKQFEQEAERTGRILQGLDDKLFDMNRQATALTLVMLENSEAASDRAKAELVQLGNMQSLTEALQDSDYAFKNLAENLRQNLLTTISAIGDAISQAVLDGDNLADLLSNVFNDLGRRLVQEGIQTLVNEGATALISQLPAQIGEGLGTIFPDLATGAADAAGAATEAVTLTTAGTTLNAAGLALNQAAALLYASATADQAASAVAPVAGAAAEAAPAVAQGAGIAGSIATAVAPLSAAGFALNQAALQLNIAATQLITAAGTLTAGSSASGASGFASLFGTTTARYGGLIKPSGVEGYARGGVISGPGTSTSDSIMAVKAGGKKREIIAVSDGEAILNAKAVDFLGSDFIHAMNAGKINGYADGAVMGRSDLLSNPTPAKQPAAPAAAAPKMETNIINAIDSPSVLAAALGSSGGSRSVINWLSANKSRIQRILQ